MKGRDKETNPLGSIIKQMFNEYSLERKYDETELITSWRKIVGDPIADRTGKIYIKSDTLFVELESSSLKHELNMSKNRILSLIEETLGQSIVKHLVFL